MNATRSPSGSDPATGVAALPLRVLVCGPADDGRSFLERFVTAHHARAYRSRGIDFPPTLVGVASADGTLLAVAGARPAAAWANLDADRLLGQPVDALLSSRLARPVDRVGTAEIHTVASVKGGSNRLALTTLLAYLDTRGVRWATLVATRSLARSLTRLGADALDLGPVDPERLGAALPLWGTFFDDPPHVLALSPRDVCAAAADDDDLATLAGGIWRRVRLLASV